jgi:hypothetical protein
MATPLHYRIRPGALGVVLPAPLHQPRPLSVGDSIASTLLRKSRR